MLRRFLTYHLSPHQQLAPIEGANKEQSKSDEEIYAALHSLLNEEIPHIELVAPGKQAYSAIPHCRQIEIWDCGIACVLMVLRWLDPENEYSSKMSNEEIQLRLELLDKIGAESIWTADIVLQIHNLLQTRKASYIFCSKTLQVEDEYSEVGYYKSSFQRDQERVTEAFKSLLEFTSCSVFCTPHLPLTTLLNATCNPKCVTIVLIDNHVLHSKSLEHHDGGRYVGHYVILCGISRDNNHVEQSYLLDGPSKQNREDYCVVLTNPGMHAPPTMYISPLRFEKSWRSNGTDNDAILIIRQD